MGGCQPMRRAGGCGCLCPPKGSAHPALTAALDLSLGLQPPTLLNQHPGRSCRQLALAKPARHA